MAFLDFSGLSRFKSKLEDLFAKKSDTVLETTLSRGRKANTTVGTGSFAFGNRVTASGNWSHAEGEDTTASGPYSHAEGYSVASAPLSHAEGSNTTASGANSHAEGGGTIASGNGSHAEGSHTTASGGYSHAEGYYSSAGNTSSHAEGSFTTASGAYSHAEGSYTTASGSYSHAEGLNNTANGYASHVGGSYCIADTSYPLWDEWVSDTHYYIGDKVKRTTQVSGEQQVNYYVCKTENTDSTFSSANWYNRTNYRKYAEIIGNGYDLSSSARSNARALDWDGNEYLNGDLYVNCNNDSTGGSLVATATDTVLNTTLSRGRADNSTIGTGSFAFGNSVTASGDYAHAEGNGARATALQSHAEGNSTLASGNYSHAEGFDTKAWGTGSHTEGLQTKAAGSYAHAEGDSTIANHRSQHAGGEFNVEDPSEELENERGDYVEIIGNGEMNARSNARALDWDGNEYLNGDVYVNCDANSENGLKLLSEGRIQMGKITSATLTASTTTAVSLTFPAAFSKAPKVIAHYYPNSTNSANVAYISTISNITATGCTFNLYNPATSAATLSSSRQITWLAIEI